MDEAQASCRSPAILLQEVTEDNLQDLGLGNNSDRRGKRELFLVTSSAPDPGEAIHMHTPGPAEIASSHETKQRTKQHEGEVNIIRNSPLGMGPRKSPLNVDLHLWHSYWEGVDRTNDE